MSENERLFEVLRKQGTKKRLEFNCVECGGRTSGWPDSPRVSLKLCIPCATGKPNPKRRSE